MISIDRGQGHGHGHLGVLALIHQDLPQDRRQGENIFGGIVLGAGGVVVQATAATAAATVTAPPAIEAAVHLETETRWMARGGEKEYKGAIHSNGFLFTFIDLH